MEEKKMQELNLDEMDKVSGGGWVDENGITYMYPDKCLCGGRFILDMLMGGWAYCYCEKCGHKAIGPY